MSLPLSIIIPWRGGNPVREKSLTNMLNCLKVQETNKGEDPIRMQVIIVEQTDPDHKDSAQQRLNTFVPEALAGYKYIQLVHESKAFNKSWCINVAARQAMYDHLLIVDADSLFGSLYLTTISHAIEKIPHPHNKMVICWNYIIGMPGKDNPIARHIRPDAVLTLGGIWYAERNFYFDEFGGMNENFFGYGGEDNEAYERACAIARIYPLSYIAYPLVHQYHDWEKQSPVAIKYFELGRKYPHIIRDRLKKANIGNLEHPTLIKMDDLTL